MERWTASSGKEAAVGLTSDRNSVYSPCIDVTHCLHLQGLTKEGEKTSYILSDCLKDEEPHMSVTEDMNSVLFL